MHALSTIYFRYVAQEPTNTQLVGQNMYSASAATQGIRDEVVTHVGEPQALVEALMDLYYAPIDAEEEGHVLPEQSVLRLAEGILRRLHTVDPRPYSVYSMPDGEVTIDARTIEGTKVVVSCNPDGTARLLTYMDGEYEEECYQNPELLPDCRVREALRKTRTIPPKSW